MKKKHVFAALGAGLMLASAATMASASEGATYDAVPDPLPASLPSLGFQATRTSEVGDLIRVSVANQRLDSVVVTMVSWACEYGSWNKADCATTPGATFEHPLTLSLYEVGENGAVGAEIKSVTTTFEMPYRPSPSPECTEADAGKWFDAASSSCQNGYAFNVTFPFSTEGVTLPRELVYGISYNTQSYGDAPIGEGGPFNSLNVGLNTDERAPYVGGDVDPDVIYWDSTYGGRAAGLSPDSGWTGFVPAVRFNTVPSGPAVVEDCKNGGAEALGFANLGQCISSAKANERFGK